MDILDAGEDEIKNIGKTHCLDLQDIARRLRLKNHANWLLTIHLALDHTLSIFVSQKFVAQAVIDVDRWAVAQKIDLLFSMGLIDKGLSDALRKINSLRNKAAHKLNFRVSSADVEAVVALCSFPPEEVEEIGGRERFPVALLTILLCPLS